MNISTARAGWVATLAVCLLKVLVGGVTVEGYGVIESPDYTGMALLLGAVGAVHWSREQTKSKERIDAKMSEVQS